MKNYILIILLCILFANHAFTQLQFNQAVIGSSGSTVTANSLVFSQQTGELNIQTKTSASVIFTEGFQQGVKDICNGLDDDFDGEVDEDASFINWYLDADNDGYYFGAPVFSCSSPGASYVSSTVGAGDCDDNNAAINPGAAEICGNGIDDNCNGQIDENCCAAPSGLFTSNITSTTAVLNWVNVNGAIRYVVKYKKLGAGQPWFEVNPKAPASSSAISNLIPSSQYKWVMRTRCANGFSPNSRVIYFTTASSASAAKNSSAEISVQQPVSQLNISPNPAIHDFTIQLNTGNSITEKGTVQISDINGIIVYQYAAAILNGQLYYTVNINNKFSEGIYFIRIITDKNIYTEKIMITR